MAFEQDLQQKMEESFWLVEDQKVEKNYPPNLILNEL